MQGVPHRLRTGAELLRTLEFHALRRTLSCSENTSSDELDRLHRRLEHRGTVSPTHSHAGDYPGHYTGQRGRPQARKKSRWFLPGAHRTCWSDCWDSAAVNHDILAGHRRKEI